VANSRRSFALLLTAPNSKPQRRLKEQKEELDGVTLSAPVLGLHSGTASFNSRTTEVHLSFNEG